jgi:hypothetical protein
MCLHIYICIYICIYIYSYLHIGCGRGYDVTALTSKNRFVLGVELTQLGLDSSSLLSIIHLFLIIIDFFVNMPFWLVYMETCGIDFKPSRL